MPIPYAAIEGEEEEHSEFVETMLQNVGLTRCNSL